MKRIYLCLFILVIQLATTSCLPIHSEDAKDSFSTWYRTTDGKVILFVDACYSGNLSSGGLNMIRFLNEASDPNKQFIVFSSSSKSEESLEHKDWKNGAFTKAFKEVMQDGKLGENEITVKDLDAYITKRVRKLTDGKQTPESGGTGKHLIIAELVK